MPKKCSVPICKSNYDSEQGHTTIFSFPSDLRLRELWLAKIPRKDFVPTKQSGVCIKHFDEQFVIRDHEIKKDDGTLLVLPRNHPILTKDAYPTIFENYPSYLSSKLPLKRKNPETRHVETMRRDEENFQQWLLKDKINSLSDFRLHFKSKLPNTWLALSCENEVHIGKFLSEPVPKLIICVKFNTDLTFQVWHKNIPISTKQFEWIFGKEQKLNSWTAFDSFLSHLNSFDNKIISNQQLIDISNLIEECVDNCLESDKQLKLKFIAEQLRLLSGVSRYSVDIILWASIIYFTYPSAYRAIRDSKKLLLPHPSYLKKFLKVSGNLETGLPSKQEIYLLEKNRKLLDREKIVGIMFDEIYVKPTASFKGGKIEGIATNCDSEATTLQAFMISSVFSKNKDIVGLYPMKNQVSDDLHTILLSVLKVLYQTGYDVLYLVGDNNQVNRKMYYKLCGGELTPSIKNPYNKNQEIFILFDTVHLIKSVRNNWINQKEQSFHIPPFTANEFDAACSSKQQLIASVNHLKVLHEEEQYETVKFAPSLTWKALYPTNFERQNVKLALVLFDDKLIAALELIKPKLGETVSGTINFIQIFSRWWKIVNTKTPLKGIRLRDPYCNPIKSIHNDPNLEYLKKFSTWLQSFENLDVSHLKKGRRLYKLTKETYSALLHTTDTLVELAEHLLCAISPVSEYVLLGKFQSDSLEARFGQYRQMSGANYHVSVVQILESERKLKLISLLNLQSATKGKFKITSFMTSSSESKSQSTHMFTNPDWSEQLMDIEDIEISETNLKVLVYISGYVTRVASKSCLSCRSKLSIDHELQYETANEDVNKYLGILDRGGLLWPNDLSLNVTTISYQTFQKCISKEYENLFLKLSNQRSFLIDAVEEKLEELGYSIKTTCECGKNGSDLISALVKSLANIFLNNYCKVINDKLSHKEKPRNRKKLKFMQK